jgi:hypothetical protein
LVIGLLLGLLLLKNLCKVLQDEFELLVVGDEDSFIILKIVRLLDKLIISCEVSPILQIIVNWIDIFF